jgi:hypothetical protein
MRGDIFYLQTMYSHHLFAAILASFFNETIVSFRGILAIRRPGLSVYQIQPGKMETIPYSHFFIGFSTITGAHDAQPTNLSNLAEIEVCIPEYLSIAGICNIMYFH